MGLPGKYFSGRFPVLPVPGAASLIQKQDAECSIVEYASADEYLADGKEHDLVFLDIEMGGYGVELDGMAAGTVQLAQGVGGQRAAFPGAMKAEDDCGSSCQHKGMHEERYSGGKGRFLPVQRRMGFQA